MGPPRGGVSGVGFLFVTNEFDAFDAFRVEHDVPALRPDPEVTIKPFGLKS